MTRDYKHAKKARDRRSTRRRRTDEASTPGWVWLLAGLIIGLLLAGVAYYKDLVPAAPTIVSAGDSKKTPAKTETKNTEAGSAEEAANKKPGFDFYEMLPSFEVVIPEKELDVRRDRERTPVREQGSYILQVGAFQKHADADRVKAKLALMGVESNIQKVSIDRQTWHRVRVGPIRDLDELNAMRAKLLDAGVEMLIIRSGA
ncbi:MAG: SPOR domain-containing protein [Gammaproteobacteria bacterium]|nr:SPOR domain-containing protein [Gammaproteobacteria bacterium]